MERIKENEVNMPSFKKLKKKAKKKGYICSMIVD